ncbi:hypothetical protein HTS88_12155 [Pseudarthrobacter oxydans]|uniref:hypothetical protein n=1 Tax=Pseudarthrobacter oxydans TaxID=1671 RepID=UPI001572C3AF|nr:hypothetical protein [Pseudarthrobacter oxydans]NSX37153.1 hypothetical protein [Pseudarthrobacter oxydans]
MSDDDFNFDDAIAKKHELHLLSESHARELEAHRALVRPLVVAWKTETEASGTVHWQELDAGVGAAFREFRSRGGRVRSDKKIWIPPEHPAIGKVGLDEYCMPVPAIEYRFWSSYESDRARKAVHETECETARRQMAKKWDAKYRRFDCIEFHSVPSQMYASRGWVFHDAQDGRTYFFQAPKATWMPPPSLQQIRERLVDMLYEHMRKHHKNQLGVDPKGPPATASG